MAGIILGALGGAGQEAAKFGGRMQQGAIDADLENLRSENLQNRTIALEKIREEAGIRAEDRGIMNRSKERGMIVDETLANKPRLTQAEIDAENAKGTAALDFYGKNRDAVLGKKRDEAAAGRNPLEDRTANLKLEMAKIDLEYKKQEAKLPPAIKARAESVRDEIKTINAAIAKAQAEGMFDANSDNAKSLMDSYAAKAKQLDQLLSPYYGEKGPKADDKTKQDVRVGGQVIGQASTPEEAQAMAAEYAKTRKAGGKAAPKADNAPDYNEAGYADVQATIDGAKRGDEKAKAMLPKLISRGMTNPGQRQQIDAILNR